MDSIKYDLTGNGRSKLRWMDSIKYDLTGKGRSKLRWMDSIKYDLVKAEVDGQHQV